MKPLIKMPKLTVKAPATPTQPPIVPTGHWESPEPDEAHEPAVVTDLGDTVTPPAESSHSLDADVISDSDAPKIDFKSAMAPVVPAKTVEPLLPNLDEVVNQETGNVFHVIGLFPNGMRVSFRIWKGKITDINRTPLEFRIRVGDPALGDLSVPLGSAGNVVVGLKPMEFYTKLTSLYGSVQGFCEVPAPAWEPANVAEAFLATHLPNQLYAALLAHLQGLVVSLTADQFDQVCGEMIHRALHDIVKPLNSSGKPAQYFWGHQEQPILSSHPGQKVKPESLASIGL